MHRTKRSRTEITASEPAAGEHKAGGARWLRLLAPWKAAAAAERGHDAENDAPHFALHTDSPPASAFADGGVPYFATLLNYADAALGAHVLFATDEYRCTAANILIDSPTHAWTSRRRRVPGYDWCLVKLPVPVIIRGVEVTTTADAPPHVSLEAALEVNDLASKLYGRLQTEFPDFVPRAADSGCLCAGSQGSAAWEIQRLANKVVESAAVWRNVIEVSQVKRDAVNYFEVIADSSSSPADLKVDVIRLNMLPDGGIRRLRIFGECALDIGCVHKMKERESKARVLDYASASCGAQICFASAGESSAANLLLPANSVNVQSWVTPRQPLRPMFVQQPLAGAELKFAGSEFVVIALAARCLIHHVDVNTTNLHGDLPYKIVLGILDSSEIRALPMLSQKALFSRETEDQQWFDFGTLEDLQGDEEYTVTLNAPLSATHVRVSVIPDGGVTRVRVNGRFYELDEGGARLSAD